MAAPEILISSDEKTPFPAANITHTMHTILQFHASNIRKFMQYSTGKKGPTPTGKKLALKRLAGWGSKEGGYVLPFFF